MPLPDESVLKADIVFCVDESGSMSGEHAWLHTAVPSLESSLKDSGVQPNRYSLVGYGRRSDPSPKIHVQGTTAEDFVAHLSNLSVSGSLEDGYAAIDHALTFINFREDAEKLVVLVTDEDRDVFASGLSKSSIFNDLMSNDVQLNVVCNIEFAGSPIGVDAAGTGFFIGSNNTLDLVPGSNTVVGGFKNTFQDYVELAWSVGGSVFDLNILRRAGSVIPIFSQAFIVAKTGEITGDNPTNTLCQFNLNPEEQAFFCPAEIPEDDVVRVTDLQGVPAGESIELLDFLSQLPAAVRMCMHLRISFFSNPEKTSLVYSSHSQIDQKRWFVENNVGDPPCQMTSKGVVVSSSQFPSVFYTPDILPATLTEQQLSQRITDIYSERSLVCGTPYYVTIEAVVNEQLFHVQDQVLKFSCSLIDRGFWRDNLDEQTWTCSGQGKSDFRISQTSNQAIKPSVAANIHGNFAIAWEDFRENKVGDLSQVPDIFYGIWDASADLFWSSGQGRADVKAVHDSHRPLVIADPGQNFVFSGANLATLKRTFCPQPTEAAPAPQAACVFSDDEFFDIDNTNRDAAEYLKVRVYDQDTKASYALSADDVIAVVRDCFIRFDVVGAPGTFAVRLRNEDQDAWSSWVNIDTEFSAGALSAASSSSGEGGTANIAFNAHFIDNDRFLVPWVLSAGNGVKRVCVQILTHFGITKVFCVNVFADIAEIDYKVEFSYESDFSITVDQFKGLPVVRFREGQDNEETEVHIRVTFDDVARLEKFESIRTTEGFTHLDNNPFTFNFIQQGINDQFVQLLTTAGGGIYTGSFKIQTSDGIYNKDGLCAIIVNVPNPCTKLRDVVCFGNDDDFLNPNQINAAQDFSADYSVLSKISADKIFDQLKTSKLAKVTDIQSFKQLYDVDDPRFSFGDPKFFIKA